MFSRPRRWRWSRPARREDAPASHRGGSWKPPEMDRTVRPTGTLANLSAWRRSAMKSTALATASSPSPRRRAHSPLRDRCRGTLHHSTPAGRRSEMLFAKPAVIDDLDAADGGGVIHLVLGRTGRPTCRWRCHIHSGRPPVQPGWHRAGTARPRGQPVRMAHRDPTGAHDGSRLLPVSSARSRNTVQHRMA